MWQSIKLYLFSKDPLVIKIIENSVKVVEIPLVVFENFDPSFINENELHNIFTFFDDSIANISGIPDLPYPKVLLHKKNATPIKGFDHYIRKPFLPTEIVDYLKPQIPKEEASLSLSNNSPDKLFGSDLLRSEDDEDLNLDAILQDENTIPSQAEASKQTDTLMDFSLSDDHANHLDMHTSPLQEEPAETEDLLDFNNLQEDHFMQSQEVPTQEFSDDIPLDIDTPDMDDNLIEIQNADELTPDITKEAQQSSSDTSNEEIKDDQQDLEPEVVEVSFDRALLEISDPIYSDRIFKNDHLASKVAELDKKNLSHHINLSDFDDLFDSKNKEQDFSALEELQETQNDKEVDALEIISDTPKSIKEMSKELDDAKDDENKQSILNSSEIDEVKHLLEAMSPKIHNEDTTQEEKMPQKPVIDSEFDGIKEILQDDFLDFNLEDTQAPQTDDTEPNPIPLDEHLAEFEQPFEEISSDIEELELEENDILEALNLPTSYLPKTNNEHTLNCSGQELIELINTTSKEQLEELLKDAKIHIQLAKHGK